MKTIRVNFGSIDIDGLTVSQQKCASSTLYVGDMVLAIEEPGSTCMASVASIEPNGVVRLVLDPVPWHEPAVA